MVTVWAAPSVVAMAMKKSSKPNLLTIYARVKQLETMSIPWGWAGPDDVPESDKGYSHGVHGETDPTQERALVTPRRKDDMAHCVYGR